jgi:uncharacterized protein (TIGR03085 family)
MTNWARIERTALCELLTGRGPDAPTLCGDWTTRDHTAHLVIRERRPDAGLGIVVPFGPARSWTGRVQSGTAERAYDELVDQVRNGPPVWSPLRVSSVDAMVNTVEYFVHHEDVRRAVEGWEPRSLPAEEQDALWSALGRMKLLVRRSPVGLTFERPGGEQLVAKQADRTVTVTGEPGELILFAYGRGDHAKVDLAGEADAIADLRAASFGI